MHLVNAWTNENGLCLGQVKVDDKSNEITAIPTLLSQLELKDCIITMDAMGTQKEIAKQIAEHNDYVLALKGNHGNTHDDVTAYFELENKPFEFSTLEKGHGRIEQREYFLETDIQWLENKNDWVKLKGIGAVRSTVTKGEKTTVEIRYFLTTLTDLKTFAKAVRGHWGVENSLHWTLDVILGEDASRTRKDYSARNLALVRKISLNVLKSSGELADDKHLSLPSQL